MKKSFPFINLQSAFTRNLLFFFILAALAWSYRYWEILFLRPSSVHQWRQTDCLSLADNYYEGEWNLFKPTLHLLFSDGETTGKSAGEFPILYYVVGILWKIFGKHEFIFRLLTIAISFAGMYALFRLAYALLKSFFWAMSTVILLFSSPIYAFYTNNFLINVPAFSLMLIALWYFYLFWQSGRNTQLYKALFFFAWVGLFKISTLMTLVVIGFIYASEVFGFLKFKRDGKVFKEPLKQGVAFGVMMAVVASWYLYTNHYNAVHGGKYTLNYIQSYWASSLDQIHSSLKSLRNFIVFQVLSIPTFLYLILCLCYLGMNFRKLDLVWKVAIPLFLIGYYCFVMLFFYSLDSHDYYHVDFLIVPIVIHLAFLHYLKKNETSWFHSGLTKLFFSAFLLYNVLYCANNMRMRYWGPGEKPMYTAQLIAPKIDVENWAYFHWVYRNKPYETVTPVLRSMGIKRSDAVVCPDDFSYSITLYLMDQKGWTNMETTLKDSLAIIDRVRHGAKYMMIADTAIKKVPFLVTFEQHELMNYQGLHIYDLRPFATSKK
jgi:hypothetical protein